MVALARLAGLVLGMKLHGWCEKCHKIKRVQVSVPRPGGVQTGICDDCDDAGVAQRQSSSLPRR